MIVNNWRASHGFPLNTLQMGLRDRARAVDTTALVAQRIKRLPSIEAKLRRFRSMQLARMNDLGGCRAVVRSVHSVDRVVDLHKTSEMRHELIAEYDYILNPQDSGYRGYHLVYAYRSDKNTTYNGLRIEVQIRSQYQHAWATAVETVGTLIRQSLKASQGDVEWLRFFSLMGADLANRERTPAVPKAPNDPNQLRKELKDIARRLDVVRRLSAYGAAVRTTEDPATRTADYFLLTLEPNPPRTQVAGYRRAELPQATSDYLAEEQRISGVPGADVVLVSVGALSALRRAYPNYFLDTVRFVALVQAAIA